MTCGRTIRWLLPLLLVLLVCADSALACPTCKDQLANDPAAMGLARGYFYSILFMLSMPVLILAGLSSYFYYEVCKARRRMAVQKPVPQPTAVLGQPRAANA
jgi:hypothetical protein